jgi:hypothetical protein
MCPRMQGCMPRYLYVLSKTIICFGHYIYFAVCLCFSRWYPIEREFYVFDVESFACQTMLDHFIVGQVDPTDVADGAEFRDGIH